MGPPHSINIFRNGEGAKFKYVLPVFCDFCLRRGASVSVLPHGDSLDSLLLLQLRPDCRPLVSVQLAVVLGLVAVDKAHAPPLTVQQGRVARDQGGAGHDGAEERRQGV
jgi:hypothetical protein